MRGPDAQRRCGGGALRAHGVDPLEARVLHVEPGGGVGGRRSGVLVVDDYGGGAGLPREGVADGHCCEMSMIRSGDAVGYNSRSWFLSAKSKD